MGISTGKLFRMVQPVAFEDPRWDTLSTRMGEGAGWVRDVLRALSADPANMNVFRDLWPELCSEETTYNAAYAAAPHLVTFAEQAEKANAVEYLIVLGLIETDAGRIPDDLRPAYTQTLERALTLASQRLTDCPTDHSLRYLLAAVAAFRGRTDLASALQDLDAIYDGCPTCGTLVFPSELQRVIERDRQASE